MALGGLLVLVASVPQNLKALLQLTIIGGEIKALTRGPSKPLFKSIKVVVLFEKRGPFADSLRYTSTQLEHFGLCAQILVVYSRLPDGCTSTSKTFHTEGAREFGIVERFTNTAWDCWEFKLMA